MLYKYDKEINWEEIIDVLPTSKENKEKLKEEAEFLIISPRFELTDPRDEWPSYEAPVVRYQKHGSEYWHNIYLDFKEENMPYKGMIRVPFTNYWVLPDDPQIEDDWITL